MKVAAICALLLLSGCAGFQLAAQIINALTTADQVAGAIFEEERTWETKEPAAP